MVEENNYAGIKKQNLMEDLERVGKDLESCFSRIYFSSKIDYLRGAIKYNPLTRFLGLS